MSETSPGPGGVLYNTPSGPSGLFLSLDPTYQAKQQAVQQNQIGLDAARAFQGGLPRDANGNPDYDAMANILAQKGDFANAEKMQQLGISLQGIGIANRAAAAFGGGASPASAAGGGQSAASGAVSGTAGGPVNPDVANYIRTAFAARGVNPNVALGVSSAEGLRGFDPNGNANLGDDGSSAGPFQLHYGGVAKGANAVAGLGDDFTKATGLDARDPSTWKQQIDFVADHVAQNGWGAFHGAKAAGIGNWQGIGDGQPQQSALPATAAPPQAGVAVAGAPRGGAISFGGTPDTGAVQTPAAPISQQPVSDDMYATAQRVVGQAQDMDPRQMTPDQQRAVTIATGVIDRYQQEHGGAGSPQAAVQLAQNGASDAPMPGQHPFAPPPQPQAGAPAAARQSPLAPAQQGQPQSISFGGSPGAQPAPPPGGAQLQAAPAAASPPGPAPLSAPQAFGTGNTPLANDPGVMGILRSYKGGQFAGDPGAALNDMRRMQIQLGAAGQYGQGPAAAIGKTADYLEQAITRSATLTNAQRDARDPAVLAQIQQKAQIENAARLQADTDPSRLAFAGQQAQATAAGTALGQNSAAAIGARAQNAAQVAEATQNGTALGKLPEQYAAAATAATKQNAIVSEMLDQAGQFNMGANADREQGLNAVMSDLGHRMGIDTSAIDGKVAAYQQYVKLGGNLVRQAIKDTGGRAGGIQEMQFVSNTLPSPATSPDGFKGVAAFLQGSNDYEIAKQAAADAYQKQNGTLAGFESSFTQNVTPTATILHRLQQDQPAMFQQTVQRLNASPAGQAVLKKAASGLSYLAANGGGG